MRFVFFRHDWLPRLAWCAKVQRDLDFVEVNHGPWVETREDFFVEGAWDGPFDEGGVLGRTTMLGSGGRIVADRVAFSAASHVLERLHLIRHPETVFVSNSLPFVLAESGEEIDPSYPWHQKDITSITRGLTRAKKVLPLASGNRIHLVYASDLELDAQFRMRQKRKISWEEFASYADYRAYLDGWIRSLAANASAPTRQHPFWSLATLSSGYDSPACAVLAKESTGCAEALTIGRAREGFDDLDDSGARIGRFLGFNVTERERTTYLSAEGFPEAEFVACGTGGSEVVFMAFEDQLPQRFLFTGYLGDTIWGLRSIREEDVRDLEFTFAAGVSFMEFRLRVGFLHFPLPQAHLPCRPSIQRISHSAEMKEWRVGGDYDRPIPRRILEEAGVPRDFFGRSKKAVTAPLRRAPDLAQVMNPGSYADLKAFVAQSPTERSWVRRTLDRILRTLYKLNLRVNWRFRRRFGNRKSFLTQPLVNGRYEDPVSLNSWLFHWGVSTLMPRYRRRGSD